MKTKDKVAIGMVNVALTIQRRVPWRTAASHRRLPDIQPHFVTVLTFGERRLVPAILFHGVTGRVVR
mgnify:CR=1 FL=1